jgi:hypothetical protein
VSDCVNHLLTDEGAGNFFPLDRPSVRVS